MKTTNDSVNYDHYSYVLNDCQPPLIETIQCHNEISKSGTIFINEILFVLRGKCEMISDIYPFLIVNENEAVFVPSGTNFRITASGGSSLVVIRFEPIQKIVGSYLVERLYGESKKYTFPNEAGKLVINDILKNYLSVLEFYLQNNATGTVFYEIKIKELLIILSKFYDKKDLCHFLKPILNNDNLFASLIFDNWEKAKNAKELAELVSYPLTSFNKKFKQVFGVTPYIWLNKRKASRILYEIINTDQSLKQIAEKYFNSRQQFNDYCIRNFKRTPGSIRNI